MISSSNKTEYKPYVYHIHDTITDMYYIGSRTSKDCSPENTQNYYGSPSCKVYREIIKTRPETLVKTVVAVCQTKEDAIAFEARLHKELNVKNDPMSYNKSNQTVGAFSICHTTESKAKISRALSNPSSETRAKKSVALKGKPKSTRAKMNMSISAKLRVHPPSSSETKLKISEALRGKPKTPEHKAKIAIAAKARWAKKCLD